MNTPLARTLVLLLVAATALHGGDATDAWQERITLAGTPPTARSQHTAFWTGAELIVWGGYSPDVKVLSDGGLYNPASKSWTAMTMTGAPTGCGYCGASVWTGTEMIHWVGADSGGGGRYDPKSNLWRRLSTVGAPGGGGDGTAVWTGSEMIIWGGWNNKAFGTGGRYDPVADRWAKVSTVGAPEARSDHTAVWTGSEMIVWGGNGANSASLSNGGRYNPATDSWTAMSPIGAPSGSSYSTAIWTGREMIVWGGEDWDSIFPRVARMLNEGGRYNPDNDSWTAMTTTGAPKARRQHTAVWTGGEMIVFGGYGDSANRLNDTFSYTPHAGVFRITDAVLSDGNLTLSFPTATGRAYTLWRSDALADATWIDTGLTAVVGTGATLSFTVPATTPATRFFRVRADP